MDFYFKHLVQEILDIINQDYFGSRLNNEIQTAAHTKQKWLNVSAEPYYMFII